MIVPIVGTRFYILDKIERILAIADLTPASPVQLKRDIDNPHHDRAISVFIDEQMFGFLPRPVAETLAPGIDSGAIRVSATIAEAGSPFLNLKVEKIHD